MIGGAYVGFAARDGRRGAMTVELVGCLWFGALALAGLALSPLLIAGGLMAHALWDLVHHRHGLHAETPDWYVLYCVLYDVMLGGFLLWWW